MCDRHMCVHLEDTDLQRVEAQLGLSKAYSILIVRKDRVGHVREAVVLERSCG